LWNGYCGCFTCTSSQGRRRWMLQWHILCQCTKTSAKNILLFVQKKCSIVDTLRETCFLLQLATTMHRWCNALEDVAMVEYSSSKEEVRRTLSQYASASLILGKYQDVLYEWWCRECTTGQETKLHIIVNLLHQTVWNQTSTEFWKCVHGSPISHCHNYSLEIRRGWGKHRLSGSRKPPGTCFIARWILYYRMQQQFAVGAME
jgi:hypothetical protein